MQGGFLHFNHTLLTKKRGFYGIISAVHNIEGSRLDSGCIILW